MEKIAYVNGSYVPHSEAKVSVFDRGFLFADGIYEVAAVLEGKLIDNASHLARLKRSVGEIQLALPETLERIEEIQKDGSLQIAKEGEADSVLDVTLINFTLDPVSYRRESSNLTAARQYRMTITVAYMLRRTKDDTIASESAALSGDFVFELIGDLSSSKLRGIPGASADLAHKIVERLVETWQ